MSRVLSGRSYVTVHGPGLSDYNLAGEFDFGSDKLVIAGHVGDYAGGSRVSSVVLNPANTTLTNFANADAGTYGSVSLFRVLDPVVEIGAGFTDLLYTFSSDPGTGILFYQTFANVDQATPIDGIQTFNNLGNLDTHSATVTSRAEDLAYAVFGFGNDASGPPTGNNGASLVFELFANVSGSTTGAAGVKEYSTGTSTLMGLSHTTISNITAAVYFNIRSAQKSGWINRAWYMRNAGTQGTGSYTTPNVDLDGQSKLYVACRACPTVADNTGTWTDLTISGNSLTYNSIGGVDGPASRKIYQRHWWANVPSAASFGLTFDAGAANILSYLVDVFELVGTKDPDPVRSFVTDTDLAGNAKTLTLSPFKATDLVFAYSHIRWTGTFTSQTMTGWTTPYFYVEANDTLTSPHFRSDPSASVTWQDLFTGTGYEGAGLFAVGFGCDARLVTDDLLNASAVALSTHNPKWNSQGWFDTVAGNGGVQANTAYVLCINYNDGIFDNDQWAEIELANPENGNDYIGPAVRASNGNNGYWFYASLGAGAWYWGDQQNGTYFTRDTGSTAGWATGDVIRIEAVGTTITLKRNGNILGVYTGVTVFAGGQPGLSGYHNSAGTGTNGKRWRGGDIAVSTARVTFGPQGYQRILLGM